MATYYAQTNNGNWDATGQWNTVAAGGGSTGTPTTGDICYLNNKTVVLNVDVNLGTGQIRNDAGSGSAGGAVSHNAATTRNLTADIFGGTTSIIISNSSTGTTNVTGAFSHLSSTGYLFTVTSTGTINATGSITQTAGQTVAIGASVTGGGTFTLTGDVTCAAANTSTNFAGSNTSTITVSGTFNPGQGNSSGCCFNANNTGTYIITNVTGGTTTINAYGVRTPTAGAVMTVTGYAKGGLGSNANGAEQAVSTATLTVGEAIANDFPNDTSAAISYGVAATTYSANLRIKKYTCGSGGYFPVNGRFFTTNDASGYFKSRESNAGTINTMGAQTVDFPAVGNVRYGTTFNGGSQTGTCRVPGADSVAYGVLVDNTTGTAVIKLDDIKKALRRMPNM